MSKYAWNRNFRIAYTAEGDGEPLLLLHGFSLDRHVWQPLGYATALRAAGYRIITMDLRGHGESAKPSLPEAYTGAQEADDIAAVLDAEAVGSVTLLGYSRGGRLALDFAAAYPRRVRRLMVGGAHPFAHDLSGFRAALSVGIEGWIGVVERAGGPLPPLLRRHIAANDVVALRASVTEDRPDISAALDGLAAPCLFFCGAEDALAAPARRAAERLGAQWLALDGCNHMTALQRADLAVPHLLAWLQRHDMRRGSIQAAAVPYRV